MVEIGGACQELHGSCTPSGRAAYFGYTRKKKEEKNTTPVLPIIINQKCPRGHWRFYRVCRSAPASKHAMRFENHQKSIINTNIQYIEREKQGKKRLNPLKRAKIRKKMAKGKKKKKKKKQ
jgi:hypothetical protein